MSLNIDINNCRVCMKATDGIPIYSDSEAGKKFQFCTQLEISKTDDLPKIICNKCVGRLEIAYDFRKQAECSDKYLRQILTHNMEKLNQLAQEEQCLGNEMFLEIDKTRIKVEQIEQLTDVKPQQISRVNIPPTQNGITTAEIIEGIHYKGTERQTDRVPVYVQEYVASTCESDIVKTEEVEEEKIQETKPINLFTVTKVISKNEGDYKSKHKCIICGTLFTRNASLKRHSLIHSGERPYKCKFCGRRFNQSSNLTTHMRQHKKGKPYICEPCGLYFRYKTSLKRHVIIKHENQKKAEVKIKASKQRGRKRPPSRNTTAVLETIEDVHYKGTESQVHTYEYGIVKIEKIEEEKVQEIKPINLFTIMEVTSIRRDEGDQTSKYECIVCGTLFTRNGSLKRHSRIHSGERPYKCNLCGQCFNQSYSVASHMRLHTGETPYNCKTCGLYFRYKTSLTRHILKHKNQKKAEVEIMSPMVESY